MHGVTRAGGFECFGEQRLDAVQARGLHAQHAAELAPAVPGQLAREAHALVDRRAALERRVVLGGAVASGHAHADAVGGPITSDNDRSRQAPER